MAENKTKPTEITVTGFLDALESENRRGEGRALDRLFRDATGWEPQMWGPSIIGYGRYSYRYDSGHSGETCATGFSPRKADLVLYVLPEDAQADALLARLGKHRRGKSCLYLKRLSDADPEILKEIIQLGVAETSRRWPVEPS